MFFSSWFIDHGSWQNLHKLPITMIYEP